jgi:uncharacterized membrane protein YbhN (UPF0104 family)
MAAHGNRGRIENAALTMNARRTALLALNVAIVAAFAVAVEHYWGWRRLLTPWREIPLGWLAAATAAQLCSYALRALRIYVAERAIPRGCYAHCLRLILLNNALNLLLPMRSGEASFPILMKRWFSIDPAHATGTLLWLRVLDLHVLATIGLACLGAGWLASAGVTAGVAAAAAVATLAPIALFYLRRPLQALCGARSGMVFSILRRLLAGLPARNRGLRFDLMLSWSAWTVKLAALGWLLARLAGLPLTAGVLGAIGGDLSTVLPIHTPGGFGTYEAGTLAGLSNAQAPSPALLAAAVNLHLFVLTIALAGGAGAALCGRAIPPAESAKVAKIS